MSWQDLPVRNLDGRTGRILHASRGFGHTALQIAVAPPPHAKDAPMEKVWIQLNTYARDIGEIGWFAWVADFEDAGGWILLGDHNPECMHAQVAGKMPLFTADNLAAVSVQAGETYEQLRADHPPGTLHAGRNFAFTRMSRTRLCADWLRAKGIEAITHVGPLGDLPKKGQKVRLPVGAEITSWGGSQATTKEVLTRRQTVTVHWVEAGAADRHDPDLADAGVRQPAICWSGTGQRFRTTGVVGLEVLDQQV